MYRLRGFLNKIALEQPKKRLAELGIRPIYHQLEHRVERTSWWPFLAYCLSVTLKHRLHAPGLTPRAVLGKLASIQMLDVSFPIADALVVALPTNSETAVIFLEVNLFRIAIARDACGEKISGIEQPCIACSVENKTSGPTVTRRPSCTAARL